jgi:small subunit ribosomal protein S21
MAYYQKGGPLVCKGNTVTVGADGNVEKAMRKFKKKVLESGLLRELKERETYEKPTTRRKKAKAAAKNRWRKKVASEQLPKKLY